MPRARWILLVESNRDDELLALRALARAGLGCEIRVARDAAQVLESLFPVGRDARDRGALPPKMILLDADFAGLKWTDLLRRIRTTERTRAIPVVVMASGHIESAAALSYSAGANSYIYKPVDFARFARTLSQIGAYWMTLDEGIGQIDSWS